MLRGVDEAALHHILTWVEIGLAFATLGALSMVRAPYGRHYDGSGWGPRVPNWLGWIIMECPAVLLFLGVFALGDHRGQWVPLLLMGLWQLHYVHRTFVFPFRLHSRHRPMPLLIAGLGMTFNGLNAYVNARWISHLGHYADAWLLDPRLLIGVAVFATGYAINKRADRMLLALRKPGETGYKIPRGWLYELISCPNYLGEILEWVGWAIATWSLPGLAFALYTAANVGPRALANHRWYRDKFKDYPAHRKALVPFVL
ncbi:MAG: 3-oxo-5-alpha-steroid 4-dehydrogenase [Deltaproteobacteria bacterium]|nr:3-oxo-5-alpha-steroid 4-dehydrogenase [Deltaproteobacteria bacterium]